MGDSPVAGQLTVGGVLYDVTLTPHSTPVPDPAPVPVPPAPPPPIPDGANLVRVGTASHAVVVDPSPGRYPVAPTWRGRGPGDLVAYTVKSADPQGRTGTNQYGTEVPVSGGIAGLATAGRAGGITIPADGLVLSGHDQPGGSLSATWLRDHCPSGARVEFLTGPIPTPGPTPAPASTTRAGNIAVWAMMWPDSPHFAWVSLPDAVTEVRFAFLIDAGHPVGDGPWGQADLKAGIAGFLRGRPDRFVSFSMGGGGYEVSIPSTQQYVDAVTAAEKRWLPDGVTFMGGNVDWESDRFGPAGDDVAAVLRAFKADRPGFHCSWSPNGSYKTDYAAVARANPDVVDALGFQCYDIPGLAYATVADIYRTLFLTGAGLQPAQLEVAMMIEPGRDDRWTLAQCMDAARNLRDDFGVTKTAFWQAGLQDFGPWAQGMRSIHPLT